MLEIYQLYLYAKMKVLKKTFFLCERQLQKKNVFFINESLRCFKGEIESDLTSILPE